MTNLVSTGKKAFIEILFFKGRCGIEAKKLGKYYYQTANIYGEHSIYMEGWTSTQKDLTAA